VQRVIRALLLLLLLLLPLLLVTVLAQAETAASLLSLALHNLSIDNPHHP
jgi:hypothetical protein